MLVSASAVGLYGVVSYGVNQRRGELGNSVIAKTNDQTGRVNAVLHLQVPARGRSSRGLNAVATFVRNPFSHRTQPH